MAKPPGEVLIEEGKVPFVEMLLEDVMNSRSINDGTKLHLSEASRELGEGMGRVVIGIDLLELSTQQRIDVVKFISEDKLGFAPMTEEEIGNVGQSDQFYVYGKEGVEIVCDVFDEKLAQSAGRVA